MDLTLDYFNVFADVAKALFKQWDNVETVANDFISFIQKVSLKLIEKM